MSNPAVVKLCQKQVGRSRMWMDDNFGESIHLHIDDIRADLSCKEFSEICKDLNIAIDRLVQVEGFHCSDYDPVFFETLLWERILDLKKVKKDKVKLSELLAPGVKGIVPLPESRCVRALHGDTAENDTSVRISALTGQTNQERLETMLNSIRDNGYPYNGNYIVLYGDDNIIRDGQHRAACLFHLYGDIEIEVIRLFFTNYNAENVKGSRNGFYRIIERVKTGVSKHGLKGFYTFANRKAHELYRTYKQNKIKKYNSLNGEKNAEIERILLSK